MSTNGNVHQSLRKLELAMSIYSVVHRITLVLHMICEVVDLPVFTDELYVIEEMCKCYLRLAEVFCI